MTCRERLTPNDDSDNLFTSTTYDALNRKIAQTDLAGLTTHYEYDPAGQLTAVIDSLGQRTEYEYDQRGNKTIQRDANGNETTWTYDELARVKTHTLPAGQTETFTYNTLGNLASKTDFNGDTTTYTYNNLNQQIRISYADGSTVDSQYTISGQVEQITDRNGITRYQYDSQDRLTQIDFPNGNQIQYQYDLNGNKTALITSHQNIHYQYDALNRLSSVTDANGTTSYSYDDVGNRASQNNPNSTTATYSYDQLNRLSNLTHTDSSNNIIASYVYTLGANGNRTRIQEATGRIVDYSYDELYRLQTETITDPVHGNHTSSYSYDAVGNRTEQTKDGQNTTYSYNSNDQLQTETTGTQTTSYLYDANGNTLSKSINGTVHTSYAYTKDNRLSIAQTPTGTTTYSYDSAGIKQSQSTDGVITNYLVDPNQSYAQVIEEQDANQQLQVQYTYGDDLISQTRGTQTSYYHYDGLGSTRLLTSDQQNIQNSYAYQAFGETDYQTGTIANSYLFTGEQYDNNIGFYYLRARFYNPSIGRFQNMDSYAGRAFEPQTLHKYLYTHGNPVNGVDPSGYLTLGELNAGIRILASNVTRAISSTARVYARRAYTYTMRSYKQAKNIVRRCLRSRKKCKLIGAVLITGGADSPVTAQHIYDAQHGSGSSVQLAPAPFILHYQKKPSKRNHLKRYKLPGGPCYGSNKTMWCDEYPYYATKEGPPRFLPGWVSLRLAPQQEQSKQGSVFRWMVSKCKLKSGPPNKRRFVSIALPEASIPSAFLCLR